MKVLVTGHRGFVGRATAKLLESEGNEIVGFDILDGRDFRNYYEIRDAIVYHKPDAVLHLGAVARFADADADPPAAFEVNALGTQRVAVAACVRGGNDVDIPHDIPLVYASTGSVYMPIERDPPITEDFPVRGNSVYGCSKAVGEFYVKRHPKHIILRYGHLYGKEKEDGLVGSFISRIQRGLEPVLYGGAQSNDFTYVEDVARANLLALNAPEEAWNHAYNIGTGEELTAERAGQIICERFGVKQIDIQMARTVDAKRFVYDISKAKRLLKYEPKYDFESGLKEMLS